MSRRLCLVPNGWPCRLDECPPGLFVQLAHLRDDEPGVGLKTEYESAGPFVLSSGEVYWGGVSTPAERDALVVMPLILRAEEDE